MEDFPIASHIKTALLFAVIGLIINLAVAMGGFFKLPEGHEIKTRLRFRHIATAFIIYFGIPFALPQLVYNVITHTAATPLVRATLFETLYFALTASFLFIFFFSSKRLMMKSIWKEGNTSSIPMDILHGIITYPIALPLIISLSEFAEIFNRLVFERQGADQLAVQYLKLVMNNPFLLVVAILVIFVCAPILEEFLFRGLLQTWLKKKTGTKAAILLSSLIFAFFHFAPRQGVSNIPLITSLTLFAIYLGFLYEKKRSLFAPIALHMTFNGISVIRILFLTGGSS